MKVALITPWDNAWIPLYRAETERRGHDFMVCRGSAPTDSDIVLHGWADGSPTVKGAVNIVFLRRYELFGGLMGKVHWKQVDALICVNSWIKTFAEWIFKENKIEVATHLIYNAIDEHSWTFRERSPGKKIGMACYITAKKNLPLAVQILAELPGYELHIAGANQDPTVSEYLNHIATELGQVIHYYDHVPSQGMDKWWDGMDYCLSTSYTEGNPNNVNEAMAKGIKPVIHNWAGAKDQYAPWTFNSLTEAAEMIRSDQYDSQAYLERVRERFSLDNIKRVMDMAEQLRERK